MLKVGLTGGIACGKSVVCRMLAERGAFTIDADGIVHELMGAGSDVSETIGRELGREMLAADGSVDRARLGAVVFSDPEVRKRVNRIVHPRVIAEEERRLRDAEQRGVRIAVVDAALMIEVGSYRGYERLIVVYCPRALQIERLMSRGGYTEAEAARRVDSQMPVEDKKRYADYLVDTSGRLEDTKRQVEAIWRDLLALAGPQRDDG